MIRWILLDREIDDTAMAGGGWGRGRRREGLRQQEQGEEPGGIKVLAKRKENRQKIKSERKTRSVIKEGLDLLFLFLISTLPSLRGGGPSPRAFLISLIGSAAPFLRSLRATEGREGAEPHQKGSRVELEPLKKND